MNRESSRNDGIPKTLMEQKEVNYPEQAHNPGKMCLHHTPLPLRNMDPEGNWQEAAGIRGEVLPKNVKNKLERYDKE